MRHRTGRAGTKGARPVWINEVLARGATIEMVILFETDDETELRDTEVSETLRLAGAGHQLTNMRPSRAGRRQGDKWGAMSSAALANTTAAQRVRRRQEVKDGVDRSLKPHVKEAFVNAGVNYMRALSAEEKSAALRHARSFRKPVLVSCVVCRRVLVVWNFHSHQGTESCRRRAQKLTSQ
jgi:hypothetical protein